MIPEIKQMADTITADLHQKLKIKTVSFKNFWLSILAGIAVLAVIGGFLYYGRYYLAAAITALIVVGIIQALWLNYADERAKDTEHYINILASHYQQQLDFLLNRMNYLIDIALKVEPTTAHAINNIPQTPPPVEPEEYIMSELGTTGDVPVRRVRD